MQMRRIERPRKDEYKVTLVDSDGKTIVDEKTELTAIVVDKKDNDMCCVIGSGTGKQVLRLYLALEEAMKQLENNPIVEFYIKEKKNK